MLLLSLLFIPIIGVFLILVNKDNGVSLTSIKFIALTASIFNLFVSLIIFILFDFSTNQFQFVQEYHEISYFDFFLGIDGLSIYFILLTTIIIPISILSNWTSISKDVETYLIIILLLETLLLAVFLVLDILLFYIFFESILPPAIWSGKLLTQDLNSLYSAPIAASINGGYRTVIKQINKLRLYSTVHPKREFELDPNFVTGFVDDEGCFTVTITRDPINKTGWRVKPAFEIGLHKKDLALLKLIQNQFRWNCGTDVLLKKTSIKHFSSKSTNNNLSLAANEIKQATSLVVWGTHLTSTVGIGRFTKQVRDMIQLPALQKSVVVGLILSDGWLRFPSKTSKSALIGFKQSLAHSDYVFFVFSFLSHYCNNTPQLKKGIRTGKEFYALEFVTRSLPCFTELYDIFYVNGVKVVPNNIYELLTPVAFAHLILGDGGFKSKGIYLCTDSYTIQDVVRLMNVLIIRYELKCTLHKASNGKGYRIYISRSSVRKVVDIVLPYIIPSMYYKVGIVNNGRT